MPDCIFCRIVAHAAPADIIAEPPETVVFLSLEGHPLVVTRAHIPDVFSLDPPTGAAVMCDAGRIAGALERGLRCDGVSLAQANGVAAGQDVFHFHLHVHPHWAASPRGDYPDRLGDREYTVDLIQEALRDPAALSPQSWADREAPRRPDLVYQLGVTLRGIHPPIWRLLRVPGRATLHQVHLVLQAAMGWENYHLYQFAWAGVAIAEPDPEIDPFTFPDLDSRHTRLTTIAPRAGTTFVYEYDFGDSWEHDLVVEDILSAEDGVRYPVCLAGQRACPREDCGGTMGYAELVEALRDPRHERHAELRAWARATTRRPSIWRRPTGPCGRSACPGRPISDLRLSIAATCHSTARSLSLHTRSVPLAASWRSSPGERGARSPRHLLGRDVPGEGAACLSSAILRRMSTGRSSSRTGRCA